MVVDLAGRVIRDYCSGGAEHTKIDTHEDTRGLISRVLAFLRITSTVHFLDSGKTETDPPLNFKISKNRNAHLY
jgi:hypothetical protein